jgi:serine/threonine-protein kinase
MMLTNDDVPKTIGDWVPERLLGVGAVASVYLCIDSQNRRAAVKWLKYSHGPLVQRFRREIQSLKRLNHRGVTAYIDAGEAEGRPFLAMEHVAGTDLRVFSTKLHKRPSAERYAVCRRMGRELAEALEHIHDIGLVHRDVKPSNVLVSGDGRVVLGDFGVVKDHQALDKTAVGVVVGTLAYAAPEQIQGDTVDARTDLFGLGATLYFLLMKMSTEVSASLATEFSIDPACKPRRPVAATRSITACRAPLSLPHTNTSPSPGPFSRCRCPAATL